MPEKNRTLREGDFFLYNFSSHQRSFKNLLLLLLLWSAFLTAINLWNVRQAVLPISASMMRIIPSAASVSSAKQSMPFPLRNTKVFFIPTVHYIGEQFFKLLETYRADEMVFLITACELTLEMFGDWGNMLNIRGLGVRLDGRICNTMKAFELSEIGIKPGLTVVRDETQAKILELIRLLEKRVTIFGRVWACQLTRKGRTRGASYTFRTAASFCLFSARQGKR